jgi:hypothetical protein
MQSDRRGSAVLSTAGFDGLLPVPGAICHSPTRSRARSWAKTVADLANVSYVNAGDKMHRRAGVKMHHGRK